MEISMNGKNNENATIMALRKLENLMNRLDSIRKELARVPRKRLLDKRGFKILLAENKQGKHIGKQSAQDFNKVRATKNHKNDRKRIKSIYQLN